MVWIPHVDYSMLWPVVSNIIYFILQFFSGLFLGSLLNIEFCSHITFVYILPTIYKHL